MDSGISVISVTTPSLFTGAPGNPSQVVRVRIRRERPAGPLYVTVHGPGITTAHRRILRALIAEGRLEIVGGAYNEPSTTLTSTETTIRGAVHGLALHRGTLGAGAEPGDHLVRVLAATPAGAFEDTLTVTVTVTVPGSDPGGRQGRAAPAGLWAQALTPAGAAVTVAPGGREHVRVRVGSTGVRGPLTGLAHAVSPYGAWQLTAPAAQPLVVPEDRPAVVEFEVRPPPGTPPGSYWVVVKALCQGRIAYGPAIAVRVDGLPGAPAAPAAPGVADAPEG